MKQRLDIEAKRAVRVAQARGWSLAFEDPKVLANLKPAGRVALWAKSYFANRATILAQEQSVFVVSVYPGYTSQTCSKCGHRDRLSRVKSVFNCTACANRTHADINAGRVIAQKGSENVSRILEYRYKWNSVQLSWASSIRNNFVIDSRSKAMEGAWKKIVWQQQNKCR